MGDDDECGGARGEEGESTIFGHSGKLKLNTSARRRRDATFDDVRRRARGVIERGRSRGRTSRVGGERRRDDGHR